MERRLRDSLSDLAIATTTVRCRPAFLLTEGDPEVHGWETALLVVENPELLSQVLATGVPAEDALAVARSLQPTVADAFREVAALRIGWHLSVADFVEDPRSLIEGISDLDEVADVIRLPVRRRGVSPDRIVQQDDDPALPTTTMPADPYATTTITLVEPQPIQLLITLDEDVEPLEAASAIEPLGRDPQIRLSPAAEEKVTAAFFESVLADAIVIHDDPTAFQPPPGPEPRFETPRT